MKAAEAPLLEFMKKSPQFVIPIYQRTYSWAERECRQLWSDIIRAGSDPAIDAHFIGSVVYIEKGAYQVTTQGQLLVIDGQQRLTTVSLILEALARRNGEDEPVDGFSAEKIRGYYLLNPLEKEEKRHKLVLTQTDRDSLLAIVENRHEPHEPSIHIGDAFAFFVEQIDKLGSDVKALCTGLEKLIIVDIALSRDHDNPQLIFESMNSTGRELSQADLIRNYILMGLEPELQTRLYQEYWRSMEVEFGQEAYSSQFDGFMRHYLTVQSGDIPNIRAVYEAFKAYSTKPEIKERGVEDLVADIQTYARFYCAMALGKETNPKLADAFQDLRELGVEVAYPLLLELYGDYSNDRLSADELLRAVRLIESYVFRRAVCNIPTNSMNKTFATFGKALKKDRYLESIEAQFLLLTSYRRFPTDSEFRRELETRDLYHFKRRSYWLRRLENYDRKERVPVDEYTIEHILPQNPDLSEEWRIELGGDWKAIQERLLHTLGNLTLTGYNSEYSDHPFAKKRDMDGGFKASPLRLNEKLGELDQWNADTIEARAHQLSKFALKVWVSPLLPTEIVDQYRPKPAVATTYALEDHAILAEDAALRALFESLREQVLNLDPGVTEEILKLYVAFKAETNFVDVVPRKSGLRLSLNIRFHDLYDPQQLAKDVTNLGRWGNGDAEVVLDAADQLPYVMGLVRQSFEQQMGDGEPEIT